jgi:hypothetical protein
VSGSGSAAQHDLQAELTVRADSAGSFARLAADWLTQARDELFPDLSRGLQDEQPELPEEEDLAAPMIEPVLGPPGATWATLAMQREPVPSDWAEPGFSGRAWQRLLSSLSRDYPYLVQLWMTPLDGAGRLGREGTTASVAVHRSPAHPEWVRLEARAGPGTGWPGSAAAQDTWAGFTQGWAARLGACYGHISDDADIYATALERATQGAEADPPAVPRCHQVLRGYSWVTLCAAEPAARLGGASALAASGAFAAVAELPGGQVLLRATRLIEEYQGAAVRRVFETLAPVLLPGRPDPDRLGALRARLVLDADAADYQ